MASLLETVHNPDVLTCLANLSNDEVFTPPDLANDVLDMLPAEIWSDPTIKILDPCCKSGVFLREAAKRFIVGLEHVYPDLQERVDHIMHEQLFGIAITELTSLLSRRSLYCSKFPNGRFSVVEFDSSEGNVRHRAIQHTWVNSRCKYCGASNAEYGRDAELETHAYEFIHTDDPERLLNMKFDVIVGNPPYQLSDGSGASTDAAAPIYQNFVTQAKRLNPHYLSMIIPSRWMVGGRSTLNSFRSEMRMDQHLAEIHDFENAAECFPGLHIDGGVCYFLWDRNHKGRLKYVFKPIKDDTTTCMRFLDSGTKYVIRDSRLFSVLDKLAGLERFSKIVSKTKPFGIRKYLFNEPSRYPGSNLSEFPFPNSVKIYGVKGIKGGARRTSGFITNKTVTAGRENIEKYKLFFTTSFSTNAVIPPEPILGLPGEVCTETFLQIGPFNTEAEMLSCKSFTETNVFRFLLYFGKGTMQVNQSVFDYIPLVPFDRKWTDDLLVSRFGFSTEDLRFIESTIGDTVEVSNA